jgi:hypothetical protein
LFFFGFTGVCWGITPSLVPNPFCKPLTMDVCKVNCWVPLKMVALTSPGKCAGGCIYHVPSLLLVSFSHHFLSNFLVLFPTIFPSLTSGGDESRAVATWQQLVAMDPQGATNPLLDLSSWRP